MSKLYDDVKNKENSLTTCKRQLPATAPASRLWKLSNGNTDKFGRADTECDGVNSRQHRNYRKYIGSGR